MTGAVQAPTLRIQSVLYHPEPGSVRRLVTGLEGAIRVAKERGAFGHITIALGDCSRRPALSEKEVSAFASEMTEYGCDGVTYSFFDANLGSAAGHNRLLEECSEDFVLFLNPDVFCSPHVLAELALFVGDETVGVVEARQIPLEHPKAFAPLDGDTSWASTAGALARGSVVREVSGFDAESFFLYCDDVDFSWRVRLAGHRVIHQPAARIFHDKRLTVDGTMIIGSAEHYYAAEAAMMLAWKYSRSDLADRWCNDLRNSQMEEQRRAAGRFLERKADGSLPAPLDPDHKVAQFIGLDFAEHRFSYLD